MRQGNAPCHEVVPNEVPLFGSSWVALFVLLRDSLSRHAHGTATISPKTGSPDRPH